MDNDRDNRVCMGGCRLNHESTLEMRWGNYPIRRAALGFRLARLVRPIEQLMEVVSD